MLLRNICYALVTNQRSNAMTMLILLCCTYAAVKLHVHAIRPFLFATRN